MVHCVRELYFRFNLQPLLLINVLFHQLNPQRRCAFSYVSPSTNRYNYWIWAGIFWSIKIFVNFLYKIWSLHRVLKRFYNLCFYNIYFLKYMTPSKKGFFFKFYLLVKIGKQVTNILQIKGLGNFPL